MEKSEIKRDRHGRFKKGANKGNTFALGSKGAVSNRKEITWETSKNGCWICTSHVGNNKGYPMCKRNLKSYTVGRLMYEAKYGGVPDGMRVCHKCDNPRCINPDHLFIGTQKDNMLDKVKKGHHRPGQEHPRAKLTEEQVLEIREMSDLKQKDIAKIYNISVQHVSSIIKRSSWKHI